MGFLPLEMHPDSFDNGQFLDLWKVTNGDKGGVSYKTLRTALLNIIGVRVLD
jgi:hypothetical protein